MPASLIFGPSTHHTGPSPSQTAIGEHSNVAPAGTIGAAEIGCGAPMASNATTLKNESRIN